MSVVIRIATDCDGTEVPKKNRGRARPGDFRPEPLTLPGLECLFQAISLKRAALPVAARLLYD